MRAKNIRKTALEPEPPPPPGGGGGAARRILAVVALLALGASFAVVMMKLTSTPSASPSPSPSPSAAFASPSASAGASGSPGTSPSPSPSPSQAAPELAAMMPTSVDGTTLTVETAKDASTLGTSPAARALSAAAKSFGKDPATFEIAIAYDASGSSALQIFGFRLPGVSPAQLQPVILNAWLAADVPGVTSSTTTLGGKAATKIAYGDGGADEYLITQSDALFDIESSDATVAAKVASSIGSGSSSTSPSPTSSQASGSTSPSPSPSPAGSPSPSPS
jgi:hypothetical protein